jgi:hypothetical protein
MSDQKQEQIVMPLKTKAIEITDPDLIAKYDKLDLFVPPHETPKTYDQNALKNDQYNKSAKQVSELRPIEIAVDESDENKDSKNSHFRIHLRILNGRHRYMQNKNWHRKYIDFAPIAKAGEDPFLGYLQMRQHYDLQKKQAPDEKVVLIEETAERILKTKTIDMKQVCNEIVKLYVPQGLMSDVTIRNLCPPQYKDKAMGDRKKGETFEKHGRDTQKVKEAKKLVGDKLTKSEAEKNRLQTQLTTAESSNIGLKKALHERDIVVEELESKIRIIRETDSEISCKCGNKIPVRVDVTTSKIVTK